MPSLLSRCFAVFPSARGHPLQPSSPPLADAEISALHAQTNAATRRKDPATIPSCLRHGMLCQAASPCNRPVCVATLQQGRAAVNLLKSRVCSELRCRKNCVFFGFTSKLNLLNSRCRKSPVFFGFTSKINFDHFFFFERESFQSGTKVFFFSFPRSAP